MSTHAERETRAGGSFSATHRQMTVLSGGQSGVDQAALLAARRCGFPTGGWAPDGWMTESGPAPWLEHFGLKAAGGSYAYRTRLNVLDADYVLLLYGVGKGDSPGTALTRRVARECKLLLQEVSFPVQEPGWRYDKADFRLVLDSLAFNRPGKLLVAGNRESVAKGIQAASLGFLNALFRVLKESPP